MENSLKKEIENIKKSELEILNEFRMIRQIRQKRSDISYDESKALKYYEENLALRYQQNLNIAREFETEFNASNLVYEIEHLTLEPLKKTTELTEEENNLLQKALASMQRDNNFERDIKEQRDKNNQELLKEIDMNDRKII